MVLPSLSKWFTPLNRITAYPPAMATVGFGQDPQLKRNRIITAIYCLVGTTIVLVSGKHSYPISTSWRHFPMLWMLAGVGILWSCIRYAHNRVTSILLLAATTLSTLCSSFWLMVTSFVTLPLAVILWESPDSTRYELLRPLRMKRQILPVYAQPISNGSVAARTP